MMKKNTMLEQNNQAELVVTNGLTGYLQEIGRIPLLTMEEEQILSTQVMTGQKAQQCLEQEGQNPTLLCAIRAGESAQKQLVAANLRLVVTIARTYQGRGLSLQDLIQEGNVGLMRAAAKYDATTGNRFSTCASWWIRQAISRALTDQSRTIRLPANVYQRVQQLFRAERELTPLLGRAPTEEELAQHMHLSVKKVAELRRFGMEVSSLDVPIGDEDNSATLGDMAARVTPMDEVDEAVTHAELCAVLEQALESLEARERLVLSQRFGLGGQPAQTLEAVSQQLGLTRERVRQIERRALRQMRCGMQSRRLAGFMA